MIEEIIQKAKKEDKKVYVYAHKFPDGDAISSSCAVVQYLKSHGIDAKYIVTHKIFSYPNLTADIPVTTSVEQDAISLLLDTSTISYAENKLFTKSSPDNIYVIDHHEKVKGGFCIEDELKLSPSHVIRNAEASSTCEIVAEEFKREKVTPQIANLLTLGLLTDTATLKFLKADTLNHLANLIEAGADYEAILKLCDKKIKLKDEVGLAKVLLKTQKFPIGNTFGLICLCNQHQVNELVKQYGIRNIQKKIFKMSDIDNCSFLCMGAENAPKQYDLEFRSTSTCGDFNVLTLATQYGGGGHYHASGCCCSPIIASSVNASIKEQATTLYTKQANHFSPHEPNEHDLSLSSILNATNYLTSDISPDLLRQVDALIKQGANYESMIKRSKSFSTFMLGNELLSKIPYSKVFDNNASVQIQLSPQDLSFLTQKYHVSEDDILPLISIFRNVAISSASIHLPNGKVSQIDKDGNISISSIPTSIKRNHSILR